MDDAPTSLPFELERVIFELAAWQYPETVLTLILVARRVCIWIEPLLYHVLVVNRKDGWLIRIIQSKSPEFLCQHVHHLALSNGITRSELTLMLSMCTNLEDLALWTGDTYPELLSEMQHLTHLRRLSINLFDLFGGHTRFKLPSIEELPFGNLTHLDIFSNVPEEIWPVFGTLASLTHLSFSDYYIPELLAKALDSCALLQVLIVVWTQDTDFVPETPEITDPRFCMVSCPNFEADWELGAWGGLDFWNRADQFVASKRRGEIEASVFET
ncbi:hypothetical protein C8R43DRAFT_1006007 [Mycena crocata]|nr:hypothetical protein C8R43DRAFT_1006007 [Mycena crocata]